MFDMQDFAQATVIGRRASDTPTVFPWLTLVDYERLVRDPAAIGGVRADAARVTVISELPMGQRPDPWGEVPEGATMLRYEVFPASKFDAMPADIRPRYVAPYLAYLRWRRARAVFVPVENLREGVDYRAGELEHQAERWSRAAGPAEHDE